MKNKIFELKIKIEEMENLISLYFINHPTLKDENITEQIKHLSILNKTIGLLFDSYRDYSILKSKIIKNSK